MTQRTDIRRQKIFDKALRVAREIAERDGLQGLTARRIALRAKCSVGTVYNVFGNLDTLILYLNGSTLDRLYEALSAPGDDPADKADPEAAVSGLIRRYLAFTAENTNLWNLIFEHSWPKDYALPDWYLERIQRLLGTLADAMAPLFPDMGAAERYQAATVLWSSLHGMNSLAVSGKLGLITADSLAAMTDLLIRSFIAGLRAGKTTAAPTGRIASGRR